jgi:hypothetical protein
LSLPLASKITASENYSDASDAPRCADAPRLESHCLHIVMSHWSRWWSPEVPSAMDTSYPGPAGLWPA